MKIPNVKASVADFSVANKKGSEGADPLREVAALYEKEFHRHLLKAMRQSVLESGLLPKNQAEKIFEDELWNHYGDLMAENGSGSLREMIYKNLSERYSHYGLKNDAYKKNDISKLDQSKLGK